MKVFGPVPSRRLGKSLGVINLPRKYCSYSCLYCQCRKTRHVQIHPQKFYNPGEIISEVSPILNELRIKRAIPDYITIIPDGEPTLDINLGDQIKGLKQFEIPVAVITNGSMLFDIHVQNALLKADYVSVKVDSTNEQTWKKINKPAPGLHLEEILHGIHAFTKIFKGKLVTETMLLNDINDSNRDIYETALFLGRLRPAIAYLAIPTRPPAFATAEPVDEEKMVEAFEIFSSLIDQVELLTGYEGNAFSSTGNLEKDILSITSVHPLREEAVFALQKQTSDNINVVKRLLAFEKVEKISYEGHIYYLRKFRMAKQKEAY